MAIAGTAVVIALNVLLLYSLLLPD
jgi:hypothetical protein